MRIGCPRRWQSVFVRSDPPCSRTTRCPSVTHWAISRTISSVATPAPPPIFTTSIMIVLLHRVQTRKAQARRLIPTIHTVERLHRVPRGPLHQIIQGCDDHHSLLIDVQLKADVTIVASRQNLWFGVAVHTVTLLDQADKRLMLIGLAVEPPQGPLIKRLIHKNMRRYQYPTY